MMPDSERFVLPTHRWAVPASTRPIRLATTTMFRWTRPHTATPVLTTTLTIDGALVRAGDPAPGHPTRRVERETTQRLVQAVPTQTLVIVVVQ
jgi:hypothetical protein